DVYKRQIVVCKLQEFISISITKQKNKYSFNCTKVAIKFSNIIPFEDIYLVKDIFRIELDNLKRKNSVLRI
ncbi:hypothetical protein LPH68_25545, partial [Bacteroides sp. 1_1_30]|uniref:hypothetical protein n=1 Tax=Bacteroides sp. 1_1_30 TaxID=457387 RepID=UPI001E5D0EC5